VSPTTRLLQWISSVPRVASVATRTLNDNGIVAALDTGLTRVTATDSVSGISEFANITVTPRVFYQLSYKQACLLDLVYHLLLNIWLLVSLDSIGHPVAHVSVTVSVP